MSIRYFEGDVEVRLGDQVEVKVWFTRRVGRIVYLPGVSPLNSEFDFNGLRWVAIRTESMIIGSIVDPKTEVLRRKVKFISRDDSPFEKAPDDPQFYEKNGGG